MTDNNPNPIWTKLFSNQPIRNEIAMRDVMEHALSIESTPPISTDGQLTLKVRTPPSLRAKVGETAITTIDIAALDGLCGGKALAIHLRPSALSENAASTQAAQAEMYNRADALVHTLADEHGIDLKVISAVDPEIKDHDAPILMIMMTDSSKAAQSILHGDIKNELASLMDPNAAKGRRNPG